MIYVLDTNVFKVLENYYPANFPSFWASLDEAVATGNIISVEEVLKEIENGSASEHLGDWVDSNKLIFRTPVEEDLQFVATIFDVQRFQGLVGQNQLLQGMPVADPFIIAAAKVVGGCVVTEEKMKPNAVKIPNVCDYYDIDCINFESLMARENWQY